MVLAAAGLFATASQAQGPGCMDSARVALVHLQQDTTAADSLRSVVRAIDACACGARNAAAPDSSCEALHKTLDRWNTFAEQLPGAATLYRAQGDWELADGHAAKALDAFAQALAHVPPGKDGWAFHLHVQEGRAAAFAALHRMDSAYAVVQGIAALRDSVREEAQQARLDSLQQRMTAQEAATQDSLRTLRKQALMNERHADKLFTATAGLAAGLGALMVLFLVLYLVQRRKKRSRKVVIAMPDSVAGQHARQVARTPPVKDTPPAAANGTQAASATSEAPATSGPVASGPAAPANRISAGIFSAEEFTGDLERVTMMIREGRSVDAMAWAQAAGKLARTLMDRPERSAIADEIAVVRQYLKVEAMRWENTHFEVTADRALTDAKVEVPSLAVLPFVQAAMRLGASRAEGEHLLIVHFQQVDGVLECIISANGPAWAGQAEAADSTDAAVRDLRSAGQRFAHIGHCAILDMHESDGRITGTRVGLTFRN